MSLWPLGSRPKSCTKFRSSRVEVTVSTRSLSSCQLLFPHEPVYGQEEEANGDEIHPCLTPLWTLTLKLSVRCCPYTTLHWVNNLPLEDHSFERILHSDSRFKLIWQLARVLLLWYNFFSFLNCSTINTGDEFGDASTLSHDQKK